MKIVIVLLILVFTLSCQNNLQDNDISTTKTAMTWKKITHDFDLNIDLVGISGGDPYVGDTLISEELPILAIKKENLPRPPYKITSEDHSMPKEYYRGWAGGYIALTDPIKGTELTSLEIANQYCEEQCGEGYKIAEFHDGKYIVGMDENNYYNDTWPLIDELNNGGWNFYAFGNIDDDTRFWVYINDQLSNCWD